MKKEVVAIFLCIFLISVVSASVNVLEAYHNASQIRLSDGRSLQDYVSGTNNGVDTSQPYHDASQFTISGSRNVQDYVNWRPVRLGGGTVLRSENTLRNACHKDELYEFRINVDGTVRVTADIQTAKNQLAKLKVYRNGNYVGDVGEAGNRKRTKSNDFSGWNKGDKMELRVESSRGSGYDYAMCISNLKISVGGVSQGSFSGINAALDNHPASQVRLADGRDAKEYADANPKSSSASVSTLERKGIDISSSNPSCGRGERYTTSNGPCRVLVPFSFGV